MGKLGTGAGIKHGLEINEELILHQKDEERVNEYTVRAISDSYLLECSQSDWKVIKENILKDNLQYDFTLLEKNLHYSYHQMIQWGVLSQRL